MKGFCTVCGWLKSGIETKKNLFICDDCLKTPSTADALEAVGKGHPLKSPLGLLGPAEHRAFMMGIRRGLLVGLLIGSSTVFAAINFIRAWFPGVLK